MEQGIRDPWNDIPPGRAADMRESFMDRLVCLYSISIHSYFIRIPRFLLSLISFKFLDCEPWIIRKKLFLNTIGVT